MVQFPRFLVCRVAAQPRSSVAIPSPTPEPTFWTCASVLSRRIPFPSLISRMYTEHFSEYSQGSAEGTSSMTPALHTEVVSSIASSSIAAGTRVQIVAGPLTGTVGVAAFPRGVDRWLVKMLQGGCYIEIDARHMERVA